MNSRGVISLYLVYVVFVVGIQLALVVTFAIGYISQGYLSDFQGRHLMLDLLGVVVATVLLCSTALGRVRNISRILPIILCVLGSVVSLYTIFSMMSLFFAK